MASQAASLEAPKAPRSAAEMLEWRFAHDPDAVFLITPDGRERTYRELVTKSRLLARRLVDAGVKRGDIVGLHLANQPDWVVALFACWSVGAGAACCGALVPVAEAARRFRLANAVHVLADGAERDPFPWPTTWLTFEGEPRDGVAPEAGDDRLIPASALRDDEIAAILFTSGTTGEPKAIPKLHHHVAEAPRTTAGAYAKTSDFRPRTAPPHLPPAIGFHPFGHSAPLGRMVFRMYVGRALIILPKFDVEEVAKIARRYPLDSLQLTPAMIHSLAYAETDLQFRGLKYITSGTAPLPVATREKFESRFGVPVLQAYGATEGAITALERYEDVIAGRRGRGSVGRIPKHMPHRIVDRDGRDVAPGQEGELLGRLKEIPGAPKHPAVDDEGWYHTGDVGYRDEDGHFYITDRLKDLFKLSNGKYVAPLQVESLLKQSPLVAQPVVVGSGRKQVGALIVPDWDSLKQVLAEEGITTNGSREELCENPYVVKRVQQEAIELTRELSDFERVKRVYLLPREFSIDKGEMTPTLKIKRSVIDEKYEEAIDEICGS